MTPPARQRPPYRISEDCVGCGACRGVCPTSAISEGEPFVIGARCVGCGRCVEVCPVDAISESDE